MLKLLTRLFAKDEPMTSLQFWLQREQRRKGDGE